MKIILAAPRGFCAGVDRAIGIVEEAIERYGTPIYVRHEIVHNKQVVEGLKKKGAIFVEELHEVPARGKVIFSAHGVSRSVVESAKDKNLSFIDATCPLVKKVHHSVNRNYKKNFKIILIGHADHPEVIGTMGQLEEGNVVLVQNEADVAALQFADDEKLSYTTQTTLSVYETQSIIEVLKKKYPTIQGPEQGDICYATTNRQEAIIAIAKVVDAVLVVGSQNSSNSNRLVEMAKKECGTAFLVHQLKKFNFSLLKNVKNLGISSGASAPEYLVVELIEELKKKFEVVSVEEKITKTERVKFALPVELR